MPRVKLIRHGLDDRRIDRWGFPVFPINECPHPPMALRFDPRNPAPIDCYCRACGKPYLSPWHGMTPDEIAEAKRRGKELADELFKD